MEAKVNLFEMLAKAAIAGITAMLVRRMLTPR
jgi:hypothetical protein